LAQPELSIVEKKGIKFYEIPETKCRMHILVYSMGTKATRRKAAVHYASHSLSRGNLKSLMLRSSATSYV